jgi:hypothetical protein
MLARILLFIPLGISLSFFTTGCSSTNTLSNTNTIEQGINAVMKNIETNSAQFVQEQNTIDTAPAAVINRRYTQLTSNTNIATISLYTATQAPIYPHAEHLRLDYAKLAGIQYQNGTYGLQTILEAMDSSASGVADTLALFKKYHAVSTADYYTTIMPSDLTSQEQASFILKEAYTVYNVFYPETPSLQLKQLNLVESMTNLTGLDIQQLTLLESKFKLQSVISLLPNDLSYKGAALELIANEWK